MALTNLAIDNAKPAAKAFKLSADREVYEQTVRTGDDEVLTLLLVSDPYMLEDYDERDGRPSR